MMRYRSHLIVGLLVSAIVLVGCRPMAGDVAKANEPEVAMASAPEGTSEPAPSPVATAMGYQEGFTEQGEPFKGNPAAPVIIVEFSDYQCPFCARYFQEVWPQLRTEFVDTGRVRYVFKDFPLIGIHPQAHKAHEAARCAGEQGAYWEMHDRLFAGQAEWAGSSDHVAVFRRLAADLGLETSAFDACLASGRWASAVSADASEGVSLGVRGTPTFFINGYPLVGAQPYETFRYAIELAEQGKLGEAYRQPISSAPPVEGTSLKLAAASELSPEIQQLPPEVQEAYRFALANPDTLSKIPCYCGCGGVGHLNNRMCYIQSEGAGGQVVFDDHAAG